MIDGRGGDDFVHGGAGPDRRAVGRGRGPRRRPVRPGARPGRVRHRLRRRHGRRGRHGRGGLRDAQRPDRARPARRRSAAQHETQVEPDSFSSGRTIVTAFQIGPLRQRRRGADRLGDLDGRGPTWRSGILPGLLDGRAGAGPLRAVERPGRGVRRTHGVWLIATLGLVDDEIALLVSRSPDGAALVAAGRRCRAPGESLRQGVARLRQRRGQPVQRAAATSPTWRRSAAGSRCGARVDGGPDVVSAGRPGSIAGLGRFVNGAFPVMRPDGRLVVAVTAMNVFVAFGEDEIGSVSLGRRRRDVRGAGGRARARLRPASSTASARRCSSRPTWTRAGRSTSPGPTAASGRTASAATSSSRAPPTASSGSRRARIPVGPLEPARTTSCRAWRCSRAPRATRARVAVVYHSCPIRRGACSRTVPGSRRG